MPHNIHSHFILNSMLYKKTKLMALCEELATPVTQDGEFHLKGGFGSNSGPVTVVRLENYLCKNNNCINPGCINYACTNIYCVNNDCIHATLPVTSTEKPTSELSEKPSKGSNGIPLPGFLI